MHEDYEPRYEEETGIDIWYHNLKATYKYLEEMGKVPNPKEPVLKMSAWSKNNAKLVGCGKRALRSNHFFADES